MADCLCTPLCCRLFCAEVLKDDFSVAIKKYGRRDQTVRYVDLFVPSRRQIRNPLPFVNVGVSAGHISRIERDELNHLLAEKTDGISCNLMEINSVPVTGKVK